MVVGWLVHSFVNISVALEWRHDKLGVSVAWASGVAGTQEMGEGRIAYGECTLVVVSEYF